jgi:two-component system NtrC family response regulator
MSIPRILIVEDDATLQRVIQMQVQRMGYEVSAASDVARAREILAETPHNLVITDMNLPGLSGLELLKTVRMEHPETTVILMTAYGTVETAVEAMKAGAYDYLTKPLHIYELKALIDRVLERNRLIEEVRTLRSNIDRKFGFENILGKSPALLHVLDATAQVAPTDATILIRGETGTGKELLARAIHFNSPRRDRPFVVVNCGAIPRELLESELFGHVRGAFTGALTHKKGKVEAAEGGTVFLDEIGEMPLELQVRILRLVQEREIEKVGTTQQTKVDVRIIAATHRNLEELVARGLFREDLYYRLSVIPLLLPPLRERQEDIPEIVQQFFERSKQKHGKERVTFPSLLLPYFENYPWPGNVRELENAVARMVLLARSDEITPADLPDFLRTSGLQSGSRKSTAEESMSLNALERAAIVRALQKFNGNQSSAARYLKITRKVLLNRIAKYHIQKSEIQKAAS